MKKTLAAALFALAFASAVLAQGVILAPIFTNFPRWTKVNNTFNGSCPLTTTACTITVPSTTAGNVGVVGYLGVANINITTTTGEVMTHCSNCKVFDATFSLAEDMSYLASLAGGKTSIVVNFSGNQTSFSNIEFTEYHRSSGTATFDNSLAGQTVASCTACVVPGFTTANAHELIHTMPLVQNNPVSLTVPYAFTASETAAFALGWSGASYTVTQDAPGDTVVSSVAFK